MKRITLYTLLIALTTTGSIIAAANNVCTKFITTIEGCMKSGLAKQCEGKTSCAPCEAYFNPNEKKKKEFEAQLNEPCTGPKKAMMSKRMQAFKSCAKDESTQKNLKSQLEMLQKTEGCK